MANMKLILALVCFILLAAAASAETYLYMKFNYTLENPDYGNELENIENLKITEIFTIEDTYWNSYYFSTAGDAHESYQLKIYGGSQLLYDGPVFPQFGSAAIKYRSGYSRLVIYDGNNEVLSRNINFCNNNNACEPCLDENCTKAESVLTCGDCATGSDDNYCDLYNDGVCDADCYGADGDCRQCGSSCYYRDDENVYTTCSGIYNGNICEPGEGCTGAWGYANDSGFSCCMQGTCVKPEAGDYEIEGKSCSDFSWTECTAAESCKGEEIYLEHNGATCCQGTCSEKSQLLPDINIDAGEKGPVLTLIAAAVLAAILIVLFTRKKKPLPLAMLIFLMALPSAFPLESQAEQMQKICNVAEAYNMPATTLLAIAYKESGIQHYNSDGSIKVSADGGVGIMQRQWGGDPANLPSGPLYICHGNSAIDSRQLDAKKLDDNIECGAIELIRKCETFNCIGNTKEYYCSNSGNPLPEKRVLYSGWDIALRAYNGWGCEAPYYRDLWGANSQKYIDLLGRIQSYVESFHETEKQFTSVCDGTTPGGPEEPAPGEDTSDIPQEILDGTKIGIYYINPSFRTYANVNFEEIYNEVAYSSQLIEEALVYIGEGSSTSKAVERALQAKDNWQIKSCSGKMCSFIVDTGYSVFVYSEGAYEEKPIELKFSLTIDESGVKNFTAFEYDELPYEQQPVEEEPEEQPPVEQPPTTGGHLDGIDVSHWQGNIDWQQVKSDGKQFAFIKATESTNFIDNKFYYNINEATKAGIMAGAYHFARPSANDARSEARFFAGVAGQYVGSGYLRPVLDLEKGSELGSARLSAWVNEFMEEFRAITGVEPIIYANANYVRNYLDSSTNRYDLWVAHYYVPQPGISRPWQFWQYTDRGVVKGIGELVDLNYFSGDTAALNSRFVVA